MATTQRYVGSSQPTSSHRLLSWARFSSIVRPEPPNKDGLTSGSAFLSIRGNVPSVPHKPESTMGRRRDWAAIIDRLNESPKGELRIRMGSPGSAQVTRCRLLEDWSNLKVTTDGPFLRLRLP